MEGQEMYPEVSQMTEEFLKVQGVKTCVIKLGTLSDVRSLITPRQLVLIIPGNPGVPQYYEAFMQELHAKLGGKIPVWAVGHAGHIKPPGDVLNFSDIVSTEENLFGLDAQVSHKVAYIKEHIPADVSLTLIGHSIGCYMILNMLDHLMPLKVARSFFLFPTIERMAESPNGKFMTPILCYFRWMVVLLAALFSLLPGVVRGKLMRWWFRKADLPECAHRALQETVSPWTANYTTYLAKTEMRQVCSLQSDLVKKHLSQISFYYGATDDWAPAEYHNNLIAKFPSADAKLCTLGLKHAFVLINKENSEMADIVCRWAWQHKGLLSDGTSY